MNVRRAVLGEIEMNKNLWRCNCSMGHEEDPEKHVDGCVYKLWAKWYPEEEGNDTVEEIAALRAHADGY